MSGWDQGLLAAVADLRPDTHFVLIGPVAKIDPAGLPRRPNIHYLGGKSYAELPGYLAHWDVALMPFAINEATRFISPTKTPEYLAAGRPVVSTPITDVVRQYGAMHGVWIAETAADFASATDAALLSARYAGFLAAGGGCGVGGNVLGCNLVTDGRTDRGQAPVCAQPGQGRGCVQTFGFL